MRLEGFEVMELHGYGVLELSGYHWEVQSTSEENRTGKSP